MRAPYLTQPQARILRLPRASPALALLILCGLCLALILGAAAALGNLYLILGVVALLGGIAVIATPVVATIWLLYFASFLLAGPVIFFARLTQVQWILTLLGSALLVPVLAQIMRGSARNMPAPPLPLFLVFLLAFFIVAIFGTLISDRLSLGAMLYSTRWYFLLWPVMLALMMGAVQPDTLQRLWHFLLIVVVVQPPMALYQYLIVAKRTFLPAAHDTVVGTFPGSEFTGGQSGSMGITILIGTLTAIALWRAGRLKGLYASVISLAALLTLALAEVKAIVLLMPLVVALYFRREIVRHFGTSFLIGSGVIALMLLILTGYQYLHYAPGGDTTTERVEKVLDPENVRDYDEAGAVDDLGRMTHLVFWWKENVHARDVQHTLLGYGIGATANTNFGIGEVQRKYPYNMNLTSSSILLWETGLLGHILFVLLLLSAAKVSALQSRSSMVPDVHRTLLNLGAVGLVLLTITLPYKALVFGSLQIQLLLMLMLGQAAYWKINAGLKGPPSAGRAFKRFNL